MLATVPAAVVGVVIEFCHLDDFLLARSCVGIVLCVLFLVTAVLLFVTEIVAKRRESVLPLCLKTVIPMGVAQAVAVLPVYPSKILRKQPRECRGEVLP